MIIAEYLTFIQLMVLNSSSKKIMSKLDKFYECSDEDSYYKKRAIVYF